MLRFLVFVLLVCFLYQLVGFSKLLRSGVWHSSLILENAQPCISNIAPDLFFISPLSEIPIICILKFWDWPTALKCLVLFSLSFPYVSDWINCIDLFSISHIFFHSWIEPTDKLVNGILYLFFIFSIFILLFL